METITQPKQQGNKANIKQQKNTRKHKIENTNGKTTKNQTTDCHCVEGGGMAKWLDSPGEGVAGGGCCPECGGHAPACEIHAQAHGAHIPHILASRKYKSYLASHTYCLNDYFIMFKW